jgi:uncharacterized delta-60 repeat protein
VTQPDEHIVYVASEGLSNSDFDVYRLTPEGQPDPSWGTNGAVHTVVHGPNPGSGQARGVDVGPDGKVLVAGYANQAPLPGRLGTGTSYLALARYLPNGTLDTTFGAFEGGAGNGIVLIPLDNVNMQGDDVYGYRMDVRVVPGATRADDKILLGAQIYVNGVSGGTDKAAIYRLLADGELDTAFNTTGSVNDVSGQGQFVSEAYGAMTVLPDGTPVIAVTELVTAGATPVVVAHYTTDGLLDLTFGAPVLAAAGVPVNRQGRQVFWFDSAQSASVARAVARTPSGGLLVAGINNGTMAVTQLTPDGQIDPSFGAMAPYPQFDTLPEAGTALVTAGDGGASSEAWAMRVLDAGVMLGGRTAAAGASDHMFARLLPDGGLDVSFGASGMRYVDLRTLDATQEILLAPNGRYFGLGIGRPPAPALVVDDAGPAPNVFGLWP